MRCRDEKMQRSTDDNTKHRCRHTFYHCNRLAEGKKRPDRLNIQKGLRFLFLLTVIALTACSQNYSPKLPVYLKAEKALRSRVTPEQGLEDSIDMLAAKFNIRTDRELARLRNDPQSWVRLIDDLQDHEIKNKNDTTKVKNEKK
jgi:hypothetical protein